MRDFFVAVDVETANRSRASICQIGLIGWSAGSEIWRWSSLVDPSEEFETPNFKVHSIHPRDVRGAPSYDQLHSALCESMRGQVIVSWTDFDLAALVQCSQKYGLSKPDCDWLDACKLSKAVWPHLPNHKLETVAEFLGLEYDAHDAEADAWASAVATEQALKQTGTYIDQWLDECRSFCNADYGGPIEIERPMMYAREGADSGPLRGEVALFTGSFGLGKSGMMEIAARLGADVKTSWSNKVTLLVVGYRDPSKFGGDTKSEKLERAEEKKAEGGSITILGEAQFLSWIEALQAG